MNRRLFSAVLCASLLILALIPLGADAQGQKVRGRASDPAGVQATAAYPNPPGVKPLAPPAVAMAPAEAPKPETDVTRTEWTRLKREALTRPGKGGGEVNLDTTPAPLAPNTGTNFNGLGQNGWIPYDAAVAVGPNHVLEMTNSQWAVYTKSGTQLSVTGFDTWWGTTAGTPFDPKCIYDPVANRFVIMAVSVSSTQSFYHISVSQTSDPTGAWFNYQLDARVDGATVSSNWADFPNLGYDDNAVYLTSNQFSLCCDVFQYAKLRVFSKAQLYAGSPLTFTDFIDMRNADNTKAFTLQPARSLSSATSEHLVNTRSSVGSNVTLWRVDNAPAAPTLTRQATVAVAAYSLPPDAPQPNTGILVATNDARAYDTVTRNGLLHVAFTENFSSRAAMRYLRINTSTSALVKDITYTQAGVHYYFPAVAVDSADNVYFVFSRSASTEFASVYQTGMTPADANIQASALVKAGVSTNTSGRWGDYSGVAIDPSDSLAIWVYGGWANTSNRWATWAADLTFGGAPPPVPTLATVVPNNGDQGQNVNVTLTGTGFISGAVVNVSGGGDVTVSNTNVDPNGTTITATFNILGAALTGPRNVSVTTAGGSSNNQTFTVNAAPAGPTLNNIVPNSGNAVNPVPVTLNGSGFDSSAVINVSGGDVAVSNTQLNGANQLTATFTIAGTAPAGPRTVTVTTTNGASNGVTFTVNAPPAPTLNPPSPNVINPNNSFNMTLTGANFVAPASITFLTGTGVSASNIVVVDSTTITATFTTTAGASIGGHQFRVTTPGGNSNTRNVDVLRLPVLNTLNPTSGNPGQNVNVTATGTNVYNGSQLAVSGAGITITNQVKSGSTLTATFQIAQGALPGPRDVTIVNLAGSSNPLPFTVNSTPPTLGSVTPNNGLQGQNVPVTLSGTGFDSSAVINVSGGDVSVTNVNVDPNGATITATFNILGTALTGPRNVTVSTVGGTSNGQTFTVISSTVKNVPADYPTIQSAINAAVDGDTVQVTPGAYVENINFLGKAITVQSTGGAAVTTIDGNASGTVVTFSSGETVGSILRGFTIRNGSALNGGGIHIAGSNPLIELNTITQNAGCDGVGVHVSFGSPTIRQNTITNNSRSGCTGGAGGGGLLIDGTGAAQTQVLDNLISGNTTSARGGAISLNAAGTVLIQGNRLIGNSSERGGGISVSASSPLVVNNLIADNSASTEGGGVLWTQGHLLNNTIVNNNAPFGPAVLVDGLIANTSATNNIILGRVGQPAIHCNGGDPSLLALRHNIAYSFGDPAYGGVCTDQTGVNGNISVDPLFVDGAPGGDYHLFDGSPAIEVGDNNDPALPATDLDGNPRILDADFDSNPVVDMGAYEFVQTAPVVFDISPDNGIQGQSVNVTLTGVNFTSPATINIGGQGVTVTNVVVVDSNTITATFNIEMTAPPGPRNMNLSIPKFSWCCKIFTVNRNPAGPQLTSVSPNSGPRCSTVNVTLIGSGFDSTSTVAVSGGTGEVIESNVVLVSSTELTATFAIDVNAFPSPRDVTVTTATSGTSNPVTFTILSSPPPPTLTSLSPSNGVQGQFLNVTINGTHIDNTFTLDVSGTGITPNVIQYTPCSQLVANFAIDGNAPVGPRSVTITTPSGTSNALTFTVNPPAPQPTLSNISPNNGDALNPVNVTLNGSNFDSSAVINVSGGDVAVSNMQLNGANQLTATFTIAGSANPGPRTVTVTTPNGGTSNGVTFVVNGLGSPTLTSVSPTHINPNGSFNMTISGITFVAPASITFVTGTGLMASNIVVVNSTTITATFTTAANASTGAHQFRVTTPYGNSNTINVGVLNLSVINSVTPNSGAAGTAVNVTLSGSNFYNGSTIQVSGGDVGVSNVVRVNLTTMTATFTIAPGALAGPRNVTVNNIAGASNAVTFTVQ